MSRAGLLAALALALLATATAATPAASLDVYTYEPRKPAPEFSLPALDGRTVALGSLRGKVALVFFWATW